MNDIRRMRLQVINRFRFAGFSVTALALMAFLKLAPAAYALNPPEPRLGEAPKTAEATQSGNSSEAERIAALEVDIARLEADIANLRNALNIMGPLPDHPGVNAPVDPALAAYPETKADP